MKTLLLLALAFSFSGCANLSKEQNDTLVQAGTTLLVKVIDAKYPSQPVTPAK